jgi:hypothetical protein
VCGEGPVKVEKTTCAILVLCQPTLDAKQRAAIAFGQFLLCLAWLFVHDAWHSSLGPQAQAINNHRHNGVNLHWVYKLADDGFYTIPYP